MKDNKGRVEFICSDLLLERGFYWAKAMGLAYVREGDAVGDWYEAALPGRQSFCMRDVAHHAVGAQILGLDTHTKNMIRKFASHVSASRDYCSYWEVTKDNLPASIDYTNDQDFWYNLPANFDILQACWKIFQWTNDRDWIDAYDFNEFYRITVTDYIKAWDKNNDGIPERLEPGSRRGIPTYDERPASEKVLIASDLIAIEALAFDAFASIHKLKGNQHLYEEYSKKAAELKHYFEQNWWDPINRQFYSTLSESGQYNTPASDQPESGIFPLFYNLITDPMKIQSQLNRLKNCQSEFVEYMSYLPEIFYQYDLNEVAYEYLLKLTDPSLKRRAYPEVSFAVIAAFTAGLMGIDPQADQEIIITKSRLPAAVKLARLEHVPVFQGEICIEHRNNQVSIMTNRTGKQILWQPEFPASVREICIDGQTIQPKHRIKHNGNEYSYVEVLIADGCTSKAEAVVS